LMESFDFKRPVAASLIGLLIWALGFLTVLSFNALSDFTFLNGTFFDNLDYLTSNIMMPLGGLAVAVFCGWVMCTHSSASELDPEAGSGYRVWRLLSRYVAPVAVALIFLNAVGLFS
ncbi:MAG: sodium-dependent transporter, partial [Gammaproteobacteria bacterium]|nr:sodium-dependent transporter [Gammaproteobacteria bacterium]